MSEARARLDIEIFADCPNCDHLINLMDPRDTQGSDLNEEGFLLSQACPDGCWMDEHKKFEVNNVTCPECDHEFNIKGLDW
jgi:ssDNA-binding Zn-finger/Zn-ribbon topoisomerase 1